MLKKVRFLDYWCLDGVCIRWPCLVQGQPLWQRGPSAVGKRWWWWRAHDFKPDPDSSSVELQGVISQLAKQFAVMKMALESCFQVLPRDLLWWQVLRVAEGVRHCFHVCLTQKGNYSNFADLCWWELTVNILLLRRYIEKNKHQLNFQTASDINNEYENNCFSK